MIRLHIEMTEDEIINTLKFNLNNKKKLLEISDKMYNKIHNEYDMKNYNKKLVDIINDSLNYNVKSYNKLYNHKFIQNSCNGFEYVYLFPPNLNKTFRIKNDIYYFSIVEKQLYLYNQNTIIKSFNVINEINIIKFLQTPDNTIYVYVNAKLV